MLDPYQDVEEEDEEEEEPQVMLGFAEPVTSRKDMLRCHFPSKIGGQPAWLDPVFLPLESQLRCPTTGSPMRFLMQIYAVSSDEPHAFHRTIFLFITPSGTAIGRPGAIRAFRCQLPRENPFYPYEPPEPDELPRALDDAEARTASLRCPLWAGLQTVADSGSEGTDSALEGNIGIAGSGETVGKSDEAAAVPKSYPELELIVEPEPGADEAEPDTRVKVSGARSCSSHDPFILLSSSLVGVELISSRSDAQSRPQLPPIAAARPTLSGACRSVSARRERP